MAESRPNPLGHALSGFLAENSLSSAASAPTPSTRSAMR